MNCFCSCNQTDGSKSLRNVVRLAKGKTLKVRFVGACQWAIPRIFCILTPVVVHVQKRAAVLLQLLLQFGQGAFPAAAAAAEETKAASLPQSLAELKALTSEEATAWLNAMGWTIEFVSAFMFMMMIALGVLSGSTDITVQFSSTLNHVS